MLKLIPRNPNVPEMPEGFGEGLGLAPAALALLWARGMRDEGEIGAFLHPGLSALHDPLLLPGLPEAAEILKRAKEEQWKTVVYGDFDADGICAAALLTMALKEWGLDADTHTPRREEGYGLNRPAVEALAEKYRLLITVDLGITNHEEVALARELGMTVIVTDHHTPDERVSPADAAVDPLIGDYPYRRLCGTGVAFKLAQALLGTEACTKYLDLAALATVADIVPLTGENRVLTALGLNAIAERKRPGLNALLEVSGVKDRPDSETLAFQLAPRLNASGRMGNAGDAVKLLMTEDPDEASELATRLDNWNRERKDRENRVVWEAEKALLETGDFCREKAVFIAGEDWEPGVVGLAAGKLTQKYGCPACVLTKNAEGDYVGSLRSVPGVSIIRCLREGCDALLKRYGGHEGAAGATVSPENLSAFRDALQAEIAKYDDRCFFPSQEYDLEVSLSECSLELADQFDRLAPFGCENPAPLLLLRGGHLEERRAVGASGAHLKTAIRDGSRSLGGIAFGEGAKSGTLPDTVDTVFSLTRNTFRGVTTPEMSISVIEPEEKAARKSALLSESDAAAHLVRFLTALQERGLPADTLPEVSEAEVHAAARERGTLLVSRTAESAARALEMNPELDIAARQTEDIRCFPTLLYAPGMPFGTGNWRKVFLLDGLLCPEEASLWRRACPKAEVFALPETDALRGLCRRMDPGLNAIRDLYRLLKGAPGLPALRGESGLTGAQIHLALSALAQCRLIEYRESPFLAAPLPARGAKVDLYNCSPTLKTVCGLK